MQKFWDNITNWFGETAPKIGEEFGKKCAEAIPLILNAAIIILIGYWLIKIIMNILNRALEKSKAEKGVKQFLLPLINIILKCFVFITALSTLGVNLTSIIAALGAASITIGLALKDSLSNVASGIIILYTHPFRVGDHIIFSGNEGNVIEIQLMYTIINTLENEHVVVPNSHITSTQIINISAEEALRAEFSIVVDGSDNAALAETILKDVIRKCDMTLSDPDVQVLFTDISDPGVKITAYSYCKNGSLSEYRHEILKELQIAFEKNNIKLLFKHITVDIIEKNDKTFS